MQDEDVASFASWNCDETYIIRWADDTVSYVSAMLTQIDRYKEQFVSIKFQWLVTTLYEEQGGIDESNEIDNAGKKCEFVTTSECTVGKLRELCRNRDLRKMSVHWTRFAMKDLRRERERESSMAKKAGSSS